MYLFFFLDRLYERIRQILTSGLSSPTLPLLPLILPLGPRERGNIEARSVVEALTDLSLLLLLSAVWVKVAESGYTNGVWATKALIDNQSIYSFSLPSTLMPGQYLIRHEIIGTYFRYSSLFFPSL